ncbi:MAG TPA: acyl-CoA thioesterase [Candidatus Obscuribacterales bacterium]
MKKLKAKCPALVELMMPEHENPSGNIFGGVLLAKIDIAGAIAARHVHRGRVVTVAMDKVVFKQPVLRGDLLICWSEVTGVGNTSIKTKINVEVNRNGKIIPVTQAEAVYVAVNEKGRPIPVGCTAGGASKPDGVCPACAGKRAQSEDEAEKTTAECADRKRDRRRKNKKKHKKDKKNRKQER